MRNRRYSELKAQKQKSQNYFIEAVRNGSLDLSTRLCQGKSPRTASNPLVVPSFA